MDAMRDVEELEAEAKDRGSMVPLEPTVEP